MGAVKSAFWDEINAEPCEVCGKITKPDDMNVEAMEAYGEVLCASCYDNRCEDAYQAQFEGEPPISERERYEKAWKLKQETHRR